MRSRIVLATALITGAVIAAETPLAAQQVPDRALALSGGPMTFDASSVGEASVLTLSVSQTLPWRWAAVEGAVGYAGMPDEIGIAELQAQLQWPARLVRPYLGVGGGIVHYLGNAGGPRSTEPSVTLGAGLRAALTSAWGLRLDGRLRGWDFHQATDWAVNSSNEVTLGLTRRF